MQLEDPKKKLMVGVERNVAVECRADRLVVLPENSYAAPQEIAFNGATANSVQPLVNAVNGRAKEWGSAGKGNNWRPVVSVQVVPGGEARYAELKAAMADSDITVRDRVNVAAAPAPKTPPKKSFFNWFKKS
jgi:hypothetical protein